MARQRPTRFVLAIGLLLIVLLPLAALLHAHGDLAVLPVVCLLYVCTLLPLLLTQTAPNHVPLPLRPALLPVQIQLPPPHILP